MAERTTVTRHDDIDDTPGAETYPLAFDGEEVEIDLAPDNAKRLREMLSPYLSVGRKVAGGSTLLTARRFTRPAEPVKPPTGKNGNGKTNGKTKTKVTTTKPDAGAIRLWAKERGIEVNAKGRVPKEVSDRYTAEQGDGPHDFTQPAEAPARKVRSDKPKLTNREILDLYSQKGTKKALAEAMGVSINTAVKRLSAAQEESASVS